MGQRSRKRRRPGSPSGTRAVAPGTTAPLTKGPAAREGAGTTVPLTKGPSAREGAGSGGPGRRRPRGEERDAGIRAGLEPLGPGERPGAVTVAAVVAVILAILAIVGYFTHTTVATKPTISSAVVLAVILLTAAFGLWRSRYWAVLGFQMLLAFQVLIACLSLVEASNLIAVALCVAVIGLGGLLFYKLIRAMARIQMPQRDRSAG